MVRSISAFEARGGLLLLAPKDVRDFCRFYSQDFAQVPRKCFANGNERPRWFHDWLPAMPFRHSVLQRVFSALPAATLPAAVLLLLLLAFLFFLAVSFPASLPACFLLLSCSLSCPCCMLMSSQARMLAQWPLVSFQF